MAQTILMIDDDANIRRIAEIALTTLSDYEVVLASSGKDGLEKLAHIRPDVILLDVMMPSMDGPTTLEQIRAIAGNRIPVIFMTAKVQTTEIQSYLKYDVAGVITKPFDPMTLAQQIRKFSEMKIAC